jgi:uncharacterized membrane protein
MSEPTGPVSRARSSPHLTLGLLGGALLASGGRSGSARRFMAFAGLGVIAAAFQPIVFDWLVRRGGARRRIRISTTLDIKRPVTDVFAFCKDFENFPRVFGALRSVTDYQDGRSHWEAFAPSGRVVAWDAVITKYVPNSVIAWASVPKSPVQASGVIRFATTGPRSTRLTIEASYVPGTTGLGEALHAIVSQRREDLVRADLQRVAFYVESLPPSEPLLAADRTLSGPSEESSDAR